MPHTLAIKKQSHTKVCKICMKEHMRIYSGFFPNRRIIWRDQTGLMWNGKMCGVCNRTRSREGNRARRNKQQAGENNGTPE